MKVLDSAEIDLVSGGMDLSDEAPSTNFEDRTSVSGYRATLDGQVARGEITSHEANIRMGAFIRSKLAF